MNNSSDATVYKLRNFLPLLIIFSIIITLTSLHQWYYGFAIHEAMRIFMAVFFLVFGGFKIFNLQAFAQAYAEYDILAKNYRLYGYLYPFLEIGLGLAYLCKWQLPAINTVTLALMLVSAAGVFIALQKKRLIPCACLGVVFKIPMTYVTLFEDLTMAAMALLMLFYK